MGPHFVRGYVAEIKFMFIVIFLGGHQSNVGSVQDDSPQAARRMNIYGMLPETSQYVSDGSLVEVV